ncbi:dentin sialophosphoprotein [Cocos nucifera]|uniref:Dentin sialophosphoprotein n=1 Tax=Cocos nucifera TaxID=13894 RepID=A0A8K0I046_COCNU|nr:dentin sialophosphoprotein [Cocos nucifera]
MVVFPDDSVADLRRKIKIEHALCFPNVGEITILAIKVKRRSSFYNLSSSMLVRSAFNGIKGTWFLHIDAAPVSTMKNQAGIAENVVSENVEQSQKHVQLHAEPNASASPGHCSDKLQGVVDERQSLLETSLDRLVNHGNSSLPNASNCQIENLHGSSHGQMGTGDTNVDVSKGLSLREKGVSRLDRVPNVTDMHEEVGLHVQSKTDLVVGQEEDGGEKGSENPDVVSGVGDASIFATKKEKTRKRHNVPVNNLILDGDSEHLSQEKKMRNKENDGSFMELPLEDPAIGNNFERPAYEKETPRLENAPAQTNSQGKHLAFSDVLSGKLLQGDSVPETLVDDKRKKKKRKKSSKSHDEVEPAVPSNNGDTSLSHGMEEPHTKIGPYDNSVDVTGTVIPVGEQAVEGNAKEAGVNNYKTLTKEPDAAVHTEEATKNAADENREVLLDHSHTEWSKEPNVLDGLKVAASPTNLSGVDEVPTNSLHSRKMSKNDLLKTMSSKFDPAHPSDHVNKENIGEAFGGNCMDLHEESDAAAFLKELRDPNKLANLDVKVPSGTDIRSAHGRRKKKTKKTEFTSPQPDKNGIAHCSGDQVTEENCKETFGDTHRELGKEYEGATVLIEATAHENSALVDSGVLSNIDEKRSCRKRKKSAKSKLKNHEFAQQESAHSLGKGPVKERATETLEINHKDLGKESKTTTSHGEPVALESPSKVDFVMPSNNNDKISHHRKKKLAKSEVFSNMSSNHDLSSRDQSTRENFEKAFGTTHKDSGNESNATMLPDDGSQNVSHGNIYKLDSTWLFNDSSNKHETTHLSAKNITQENRKELLGNTHENSGKKVGQNLTHKSSADSIGVNEHIDLPGYGSGKTNFIDSSLPKVVEHEHVLSAKELPLKETETEKLYKEKSKKKRKSIMLSQDSTADMVNPSSSSEQHMHKRKYQDADPGNHFLTDSMIQLADKEVKTKKVHNEKTIGRSSKSSVNFGDTSSILIPPQKSHDDSGPEKKLQEYKSDTSCQVFPSRNEHSKHVHHPKQKSSLSDGKLKSHNHQDCIAILHSLDDVPPPENLTTVIRGSAVGAPSTQSDSADAVAHLVASSDSTEDIQHPTKRYRVAVRKVPSKRFGKALTNSKQEKPLFATSSAIFDDATSGSSDGEFVISNREDPMKAASDNSSMSADSDGDLEETEIPGIGDS